MAAKIVYMKKYIAALLIAALLFAGLAYWVMHAGDITFLQDDWEYRRNESDAWTPTKALVFKNDDPGKILWLRVRLPATERAAQFIHIPSVRQNFELTMAGESIYQNGTLPSPAGQIYNPWFPWHIVTLPEGSSGQMLTFRISSPGESVGINGVVRMGSLGDILRSRAGADAPKIMSGILCFFAGFAAIVMYLRNRREPSYAAFAGTAISTAILVFSGSFAWQLIVKDSLHLLYLFLFAAFVWQFFWVSFLVALADEPNFAVVRKTQAVNLVCAAMGVIVLFLSPASAYWILAFFLITMLLNFTIMVYVFRHRIRSDREAQIYTSGALFWVLTSVHDGLFAFGVIQIYTTISALGQFADVFAQATILLLRFNRMNNRLREYAVEVADQQVMMQEMNQNLERRIVERTQELSEQKIVFEQLFTNSPDGILIIDREYRIVRANQSFQNLFGYSREDSCTLAVMELLRAPKEQEGRLEETLLADILAGAIEGIEMNLLHKQGVSIPVSIKSYPYHMADETATDSPGQFLVINDLRERSKIEKLLHIAYQQYRKNQFMREVTSGLTEMTQKGIVEARRLGIDFPAKFSLYRVQVDISTGKLSNAAYDSVIDLIERPGVTVWENGQEIGIIAGISSEDISKDVTDEERSKAGAWLLQFERTFPGWNFRIGIAEYRPEVECLAKRWQQTQEALEVGSYLHPEKNVHHFLDIGAFQVLGAIAGSSDANDYIERTLGSLRRYDQENNTELVATLDRILHSFNLKIAAEEMFLHHKTLVQRKQRIEGILGLDLDDFEARMNLGLALRLLFLKEQKKKE